MTIQTVIELQTQDVQTAPSIQLANPATVQAIQAALREAGVRGRARFSASTKLVKGYETSVSIRGFEQTIDEPPSLGGTDLGPNPVEVILAAFGACQEIVYSTYATLLGVSIERLEIKVHGDLDPRGFFGVADVPAGFDSVSYEVSLESPSPADKVRELVRTVDQHCPVLDILQRPLPVHSRVELNGRLLS
jgi:putative redox protein